MYIACIGTIFDIQRLQFSEFIRLCIYWKRIVIAQIIVLLIILYCLIYILIWNVKILVVRQSGTFAIFLVFTVLIFDQLSKLKKPLRKPYINTFRTNSLGQNGLTRIRWPKLTNLRVRVIILFLISSSLFDK